MSFPVNASVCKTWINFHKSTLRNSIGQLTIQHRFSEMRKEKNIFYFATKIAYFFEMNI